jgi:RNA polymerase sigma-70 factor (ECF subfamily)
MQPDVSHHNGYRLYLKQELAEMYQLLNVPLFRYAVRLLGDPALAEDCVAETFSRFLAVIQKGYGPKVNEKAYLFRIAHNWITDYYRQRGTEKELVSGQLLVSTENPAEAVTNDLEHERVRKALLYLSDDQRQVIMLRFYEHWSYEETAAAVSKTVEATRALQYRAFISLRRMLIAVEE